jgi:hypothetical protein
MDDSTFDRLLSYPVTIGFDFSDRIMSIYCPEYLHPFSAYFIVNIQNMANMAQSMGDRPFSVLDVLNVMLGMVKNSMENKFSASDIKIILGLLPQYLGVIISNPQQLREAIAFLDVTYANLRKQLG